MPTVKIPVMRFRELQMGPTEKDFLHHFGGALIARGFRLVRGRWVRSLIGDGDGKPFMIAKTDPDGPVLVADPPLVFDRENEAQFLRVSQEVPGRIHDGNRGLVGLLQQVKRGKAEAITQIHGLLLAEGDDRAETLAGLSVDMPEEVMMTEDSGTTVRGDRIGLDEPLVPSEVLAERALCRKVLLLFGVIEEAL